MCALRLLNRMWDSMSATARRSCREEEWEVHYKCSVYIFSEASLTLKQSKVGWQLSLCNNDGCTIRSFFPYRKPWRLRKSAQSRPYFTSIVYACICIVFCIANIFLGFSFFGPGTFATMVILMMLHEGTKAVLAPKNGPRSWQPVLVMGKEQWEKKTASALKYPHCLIL